MEKLNSVAPVQAWAPLVQTGQVIPAIAVDPSPDRRPECIVLRCTADMVEHKTPLEQNYAFIFDKMQPRGNVPVPGVVWPPPMTLAAKRSAACNKRTQACQWDLGSPRR